MKTNDSPFVFIGNNIALDFINTEIVSRGKLMDLLQDSSDLSQWAQSLNLALEPEVNSADLARAKKLRTALKDAYTAKINDTTPSQNALATINQHLADYSKPLVLLSSNNEYALKPKRNTLTGPMLLAYIAYEGATLLASAQAKQLKRCGNSDCVLLFLDTSRNQQRRWCSMETCGNRAKASNHYRKSLS